MPTRIAKGFSLCTAILGLLCLLSGIGIAVSAWVLNAKLPSQFTYETSTGETGTVSIGNYWWGGMIYILPGIIGIVAGCTRNVTAMVLYLVFNLLCCICSLVVVVVCALVMLLWVTIDNLLQSGRCDTIPFQSVMMNTWRESCRCTNAETEETFTLHGGNCHMFMSVQIIIGAMISMAAVSSILSFIASYISCCSLCNKEHTNNGHIIISGGAGVYQPPPVVVSNTTQYPAAYPPHQQTNMPMGGAYPPQYPPQVNTAYPPPPYAQQDGNPSYGQQGAYGNVPNAPVGYPSTDTTNLINHEYR